MDSLVRAKIVAVTVGWLAVGNVPIFVVIKALALKGYYWCDRFGINCCCLMMNITILYDVKLVYYAL